MATSRIYPNLTGTQTSFAIPFDYLSKEHIKVTVNGVLTTSFEFLSQGLISMDTAPTGELRVYRDTPSDASLVTWTDGSILVDDDLNLGNLQTLFVAEELEEGAFPKTSGGNWDADNLRIENVQDPQSAQDAATKGWVEATTLGYRNEAETFKNQAQSANSNAQGHSSNSASSATASANSATASAGSATASEASNVSASGWAAGALGWRNEAEDFRDEAEHFKNISENVITSGLPERLQGSQVEIITNADDAIETGWYRMSGTTINNPTGGRAVLKVSVFDTGYSHQLTSNFFNGRMYWRTKSLGTWSAWSTIEAGTHRGDVANDNKYLSNSGDNIAGDLVVRENNNYGSLVLSSGEVARSGYVSFLDNRNTRLGYMGYSDNNKIEMNSTGDIFYDFNVVPRVNNSRIITENSPTFTSDLNVYVPNEGRIRLLGGSATRSGMCFFEDAAGADLGYVGFATNTEIRAWSYGGQYYNFNVMPRFNGVPIGLTSYESPVTTWVANSTSTFSHGLGTMPKIIDARLVMKTAAHGYAVGEEVRLSSDGQNGSTIYCTSSTIKFRSTSVSGVYTTNANIGSATYITPAQADLIIRAYA